MKINRKDLGLPSSYSRKAVIEFQTTLNVWVTLAEFTSSTRGQVNIYYRYDHGKSLVPHHITRQEYVTLLLDYYLRQ